MITAQGYSKDPMIQPDGIVLTLPVMFFEDRGMTMEKFKPYFERLMSNEDTTWNFKLTNLPKQEIIYVYMIFGGFLQYRLNFVEYQKNVSKTFKDSTDGETRHFPNQNWVILAGPAITPPHIWPLKGFQGFRYCTKLF